MKELMIHVERAVRPVRADAKQKLKMRRELLAHLTTVFEEERARLGDERAALEAARRRFGDLAELTRDLQASVPAIDRIGNTPIPGLGWFGRYLTKVMMRRSGESALRHAVRLAASFALFVCCGLFILPLVMVAGGANWAEARVGLACVAVLTAHAFLSLLLCYGFCREIAGPIRGASWFRAAAYGLALMVLALALNVALNLVQPENPLWWWILTSPSNLTKAGMGWLGALIVLGLVFRVAKAREQVYAEWTSLEIGE